MTLLVLQAGPAYAARMYLCVLKAHSALHEGPLAVALVKHMRAVGLSLGRLAYVHMVAAFCKAGALQVPKLHKWSAHTLARPQHAMTASTVPLLRLHVAAWCPVYCVV